MVLPKQPIISVPNRKPMSPISVSFTVVKDISLDISPPFLLKNRSDRENMFYFHQ